jgi:aryl carrier-like protein
MESEGKRQLAEASEGPFLASPVAMEALMGTEHPVPEEGTLEEKVLRRLFAEILKRDSIGPDDSFVTLGGDSIAMMRLVARSREAGLDIGIEDVFETGTVRALAAQARAAGNRAKNEVQPPAGRIEETEPLSPEELDDLAAEMKR